MAALPANPHLPARWADTPPLLRWQLPLPLAVFGTLRAGQCNHHLLRSAPIRATYRAFLPHFRAEGIELYFHAHTCAPFEVYCYDAVGWEQVLGPVEALEEFRPGEITTGYHRTLAWLHRLPADFDHPAFAVALEQPRDLALPPAFWRGCERSACWIYSSLAQNRLARAHGDGPLIWDGVVYP